MYLSSDIQILSYSVKNDKQYFFLEYEMLQ